jgi:hypothetical protein
MYLTVTIRIFPSKCRINIPSLHSLGELRVEVRKFMATFHCQENLMHYRVETAMP